MSKLKPWFYDEENARKRLCVATIAFQCDRDPVINRTKIESTINRIMEQHPDTEMIIFGEMILGWYDPNEMMDYHHSISEPIPGKTTEMLGALSRKHGVYLCIGLSEKSNGKLHNSQVLINPQGEIKAVHRKWNLKPAERQAGYEPGSKRVAVTEIKGIKTGMIICSDGAHPGTIRELVQLRMELILYSLADDKDEQWFMAKANARMYDAWIVSANRFGQESDYWNGHIVISDPLGNLRSTLVDQEGFLVQTLKFANDRSIVQRIARNAYVKAPLLLHFLKNWRILKSYYE